MKTVSIAMCTFVLTTTWVGCGLEDSNYGKQNHGSALLAISNAEHETGVLRTGTALNIKTTDLLLLKPDSIYEVSVTNLDTGKELARAELLSDLKGEIELSTVAHDLGEFDDVDERSTLQVKVTHPGSGVLVEDEITLTPHKANFVGHGIEVDEVQPPHVYASDVNGKPNNAFVVGGAPDPGEIGAPIYVAGAGFPAATSKVDLYIVKDADKWRGVQMPRPGDANYVVGPVVGTVVNGELTATAMPWQPKGEDVGIYDVLVDVDRNGTFDYSFSAKDGADGEAKVGFTLQYGAAWLRTKLAMTSKHLLVNLAYSSSSRTGGTWSNSYSAGSTIYSYVNPPVQKGSRHGYVAKLLVEHKDWSSFWNNPDKMIQGGPGSVGRIPIAGDVVNGTGGTPQQGCTNSPPVKLLNGQLGGNNGQPRKFDVVFDYGKDGHYDIGVDFLDVVSTQTDGSLVTAQDLEKLTDDQIFGFELK